MGQNADAVWLQKYWQPLCCYKRWRQVRKLFRLEKPLIRRF